MFFLTLWQYIPVKPIACTSQDSSVLARMEKAIFEVKIGTVPSIFRWSMRCFLFQCVMPECFYDICLQWAEQSKLLQRAQERNNNEGGVGCLGVQTSLLDPKLMSKEPKHRHAFINFDDLCNSFRLHIIIHLTS